MKTSCITFYLLCVNFFVFSQTHQDDVNLGGNNMDLFKNKFHVEIMGGPSVPVGQFGSTNYSSSKDAGLAKVGYNVNVNGAYQIFKYFGVGSTLFFANYYVDQSSVNKFLNGSASSSTTGSTDHWRYYGIAAGPVGIIPIRHNLFIDIKTLIGISHANMPTAKIDLSGSTSINSTSDNWSDAFTVKLGGGIRYNLINSICLVGNIDFDYLKPTWKISDASNLTQNITALDFNVGIGKTF